MDCGFLFMAENAPSINLLPHKGDSFVTQFLNWTLTIGRLLIILVEILALGTFLYRFTLDRQIVDLHDKIKSQSFIVANFQKSETDFRNLQERLLFIKRYNGISTTTTNIFSEITAMGQGYVTFRNITVAADTVRIESQAPSPAALSQFVAALRKHHSITSVIVDKVENSTSTSLISVSITAALKPAAFEQPEKQTINPIIRPALEGQ